MREALTTTLREIAATLPGEDATLGVAATFLLTGETVAWNDAAVFPTASVIKVAIVAEVFSQIAEGRLEGTLPIAVTEAAMVAGSGVLALLTPGLTLPLVDLAMLAICVSDNTASNLCLEAVGGPDAVNQRMWTAWGMMETTIHRPIRFHPGPNDPPHTATGTPRDMLHLLTLLAHGTVHTDPHVSTSVLRLLSETQADDMLPRYLAVNPYATDLAVAPPPYVVRHKTGSVTGVRNDAALIERGPETLAVCVYTQHVADPRWTASHAGTKAVALIGKVLCETFFS